MLQAILEFLHCIWGKVKVIKCQGQMWWHLWKGTVPMKMMCEYEKNTSSNKNNIGNIKSFMHCLWGNVKVIKGQGQVWWHMWKGIVPMMMLCEYEKNPSSNKKVISNIKVLYRILKFYTDADDDLAMTIPWPFFLRKTDQLITRLVDK